MRFSILGEDACRLDVDVADTRESSSPTVGSDANWLPARVHCDCDGLTADVAMNLTTEDFEHVVSDLEELLAFRSASLKFETMEEGLTFSISRGTRGNYSMSGLVRVEHRRGVELHFSWDLDESQVRAALASARRLSAVHRSR